MGIAGWQAQEIVKRNGVWILWDDEARVLFYRTGELFVYFEDARSTDHKAELGRQAGWRGVAF